MLTRALQAKAILLKLPPGTAVGFETPATSGLGDLYHLYVPEHPGFSTQRFHAQTGAGSPGTLPGSLPTRPAPQVPCGLMPFSLRAVFPSLLTPHYSTAPLESLSVLGTL